MGFMEQPLTPTQREWADRVERWQASRLRRDEFAAREGVAGERLSWWRWKLKRLGIVGSEVIATSLSPAFVQLEAPEPAPNASETEPLELVLGGGLVLRIPVGFDAQTLSRVTALLTRGEA